MVAEVPLNLTAVAPVKFDPLMVTLVPTGPLVGLNEVTCGGAGGGSTVNAEGLVPVPANVVTLRRPVVALVGTLAVI